MERAERAKNASAARKIQVHGSFFSERLKDYLLIGRITSDEFLTCTPSGAI
jgi:hypothetical protein